MKFHNLLINKTRLQELRSFVKKRGFRLLDLGCGDGSFVQLVNQHRIDALGVDKSPPSHPHIIASSIEDLELNKNFDVITMFHVLEHVDNPKNILEKAKTYLKKDGVLVVEVPLVGNLTERFLRKDYFAYHNKSHINFFTKKKLFSLLDSAGFAVKKKGLTLLEFPLTILTTSFKKGLWKGLIGAALFPPLKLLSVFGLNDEIIRLYCVKN